MSDSYKSKQYNSILVKNYMFNFKLLWQILTSQTICLWRKLWPYGHKISFWQKIELSVLAFDAKYLFYWAGVGKNPYFMHLV